MSSNGLKILVVVALLAVGGAALTLDRSSGAAPDGAERGRLFPDLMDRVNAVTRIEIVHGDEDFTVTRDGETWGLEDRGGYPAKFETVKQTILGVANLEVVEPKTKNSDYFDRLGLGDYTDPEATAKKVTLHGEDGVLASVIVGDTRFGTSPSVYVRRDGENQAWQCEGRLDVTTQPLSWVDRKVLQLERDRIAEAELRHPDGEVVAVTRSSAEDTAWELVQLPPGRDLTSPSATSSLATWPTYLSFDDVAAAGTIDFEGGGTVYECRTFDGLVVRVETAAQAEQTWARFEARYEAPSEVAGPAAPEEETPEGDGETGDSEGAGGEEPVDDGPSGDDVREEAEALNARLAAWAYALPGHKATQLEKRVDDLLAPLPEEEEED